MKKINLMALVELIMPKMGESIMEATILSWLKKPGDKIEQDESVLEVATDKVDTEVPSTHAGVLKEILAQKGQIVQVGKPIAILAVEVIEEAEKDQPLIPEAANQETSENASYVNGKDHAPAPYDFKASAKFFSPLVKNIAKEENITVAELEGIAGSGSEGRITKKDILDYVEHRKTGTQVKAVQQSV
ncbi:MAG TPA: biotin/lipoyl-containing protein, partial [Chryseolinea sp.]|nr:biotin/lipoyl-containing protein [Chryseolinea sp.]